MARLLAQAALALVWLTRLPVGRLLPASPPTLAQAAWAFPLVGLAVGFIGAAVLGLAALAGLPGMVAALLAVGAMILATGALHEDGLADCADGSGGATRERRLEIMRDSRIGSYGVLALVLVTGLRVAAIAALVAQPWLAAAAVAGLAAASRAGMA
ncbi:adenosylcobinamide-GDP ribazoletransferase, partial [Paracoccus sp. FO-3]